MHLSRYDHEPVQLVRLYRVVVYIYMYELQWITRIQTQTQMIVTNRYPLVGAIPELHNRVKSGIEFVVHHRRRIEQHPIPDMWVIPFAIRVVECGPQY